MNTRRNFLKLAGLCPFVGGFLSTVAGAKEARPFLTGGCIDRMTLLNDRPGRIVRGLKAIEFGASSFVSNLSFLFDGNTQGVERQTHAYLPEAHALATYQAAPNPLPLELSNDDVVKPMLFWGKVKVTLAQNGGFGTVCIITPTVESSWKCIPHEWQHV